MELLSIPTVAYKASMPKLEFNSIGANAVTLSGSSHFGNKNCNIFELMLTRKDGINNNQNPSAQGSMKRPMDDVER